MASATRKRSLNLVLFSLKRRENLRPLLELPVFEEKVHSSLDSGISTRVVHQDTHRKPLTPRSDLKPGRHIIFVLLAYPSQYISWLVLVPSLLQRYISHLTACDS